MTRHFRPPVLGWGGGGVLRPLAAARTAPAAAVAWLTANELGAACG
jgi:hypothetical protein